MDDARAERLQQLSGRSGITGCLHRSTRGMDRLDRALVLSAHHDDAIDASCRRSLVSRSRPAT